MREWGLEFQVQTADIDEKAVTIQLGNREDSDPSLLPVAVARAKAAAILPRLENQNCLLITCDQIVHYNGKIREKPQTHEECRRYLQSYDQLNPAVTCSAIVVTNTLSGKQVEGVDIAKQYFKPVPDHLVDELIRKGDIMYCAGGFMIDDPLLFPYLDKREGDEDSIIGLPKKLLLKLLDEAVSQS